MTAALQSGDGASRGGCEAAAGCAAVCGNKLKRSAHQKGVQRTNIKHFVCAAVYTKKRCVDARALHMLRCALGAFFFMSCHCKFAGVPLRNWFAAGVLRDRLLN